MLVGHSIGGLTQRLHATRYPRDVAGLVLVDATPDRYAEVLARLSASGRLTPEQHAAVTAPAPPPGLETYDDFERIAMDASSAQVRQGQADMPMTAMPFSFLSLAALTLPPDWSPHAAQAMQQMYATTLEDLGKLTPGARHIVATGSSHYIQLDRPGLVTAAVRRVVERALHAERRAPVQGPRAGDGGRPGGHGRGALRVLSRDDRAPPLRGRTGGQHTPTPRH